MSEVLVALVCAAGVLLLGPPVGLLWSTLAPRADAVVTPEGGLDLVDTETKDFVAGDGSLLLLCLLAGLVAGLLCWRAARRHPLGALLGLVIGSALAAWAASRTGLLGEDRSALLAAARAGQLAGPTDVPLQLRSPAVLLAWPAAAAATFAVLLWREPAHRERPASTTPPPGQPGDPLSSG